MGGIFLTLGRWRSWVSIIIPSDVPRSRRAEEFRFRRSRQSSARQVALAALQTWRRQHLLADSIASHLLAEANFSSSDRAFALELFYGVLRNASLLDFWIACLRKGSIDVDLRDILRLGLYQLFLLGTPEHAAVHETVELARKSGRGLINGILRTAVRTQDELRSKAAAQPIAIRMSHPEFLVARWQRNFGTEATEKLCRWNNQPPPLYARINKLKIQGEDFARVYPGAKPLSLDAQFVQFDSLPTAALEQGHCYIQDPSTIVACRLLDPRGGEKILDACAAPGGKTAHIAEVMRNRGVVVACDRALDRLEILKQNMARLQATIAKVVHVDWIRGPVPKQVAAHAPFDRILLDAPCTNTGVMRRRVDARWRLRPADFLSMQKQQLEIARALHPLLKAGGVFVYSTCSIEPEENEDAVQQVVREFPDLRLIEQQCSLPFHDHVDGAFAVKFIRDQRDV
jgi:16S rRNA (cytosine967-C5)-methyltransferase